MGQQNFEKVNLFLSDFERFELRKELIQLAFTNNWFKIFVPEYLGGAQLNLTDGIDVIYQIASKNTALGWCVSLGAGAGIFYKYFDFQTSEKFFGSQQSVIAGSGNYSNVAIIKNNQIELKGRWDYCSGAAHASSFTGGIQTVDNQKFAFIINRDSVTLDNTWNFNALKPTSSFTFRTDSLIETNQLFIINELKLADDYHLPELFFDLFAAMCLYATKLGILKCFLNSYRNEFSQDYSRLVEDFNQLNKCAQDQLNYLFEISNLLDSKSNTINQNKLYESLQTSCKKYNQDSRELFMKICAESGMKIYNQNFITHHLMNDFLLASQHSFVNPN